MVKVAVDERVPILVVSGFLGSGKTTLVRHLLRESQATGDRVAIVSNELGELGIDRALLGGGDERYVELEGGCVCCQLSDELVDTLQMLRDQVRPDRVIIETSGVALPFDMQLHLWRPPVSDWAGEDMVIAVVNAEQVRDGRDLAGTFEDQVTSADLLLLNKIDLVSADALPRLEAALRDMEPEAPIVRTAHARLDASLAFVPGAGRARARARDREPTPHTHEAFETDEIAVEAGIAPAALVKRLRDLGALRAKGFVETSEGFRLVQGVAQRVELAEVPAPAPELLGRVVVVRRAPKGPRPSEDL